MGTVYRKTFTKPLPPAAELLTRDGQRWARWTDGKARKRKARVTTGEDGADRLLLEAATYTAKYRNGERLIVEAPTGCRSLDAAKAILVELETRADKVRSGKWTAAEDTVLDHQTTLIERHVADYIAALGAKMLRGRRVSLRAQGQRQALH